MRQNRCNTVRTDATNIQKRKGFFMESKRNAQILDIAMLSYVTGTEKSALQLNSLCDHLPKSVKSKINHFLSIMGYCFKQTVVFSIRLFAIYEKYTHSADVKLNHKLLLLNFFFFCCSLRLLFFLVLFTFSRLKTMANTMK